MRRKDSSERLLRALDGEDLQLEEGLEELLRLGNRVRSIAPQPPPLNEDARRMIWNRTVSGTGEFSLSRQPRRRVPRLAWGIAAGLTLALIAVLALIFINVGEGPVPQAGEIAELVSLKGEVMILDPSGEERPALEGERLKEGDSIIAAVDSRGTIGFDEGCILRLDGEAEIGLSSNEGEVIVDVFKGKSYHRIVEGTSYTARSGGVMITARGTAFAFDVEENTEKVISLHSSIDVEVYQDSTASWSSSLEEGKIFLHREGEEEAHISEVSREELDNEWLNWNKALDEDLGLPLGALSLLDEEVAVTEPEEQPEPDAVPPPAEEQPEPVPPSPEPPPPEPEPDEKSVALAAEARVGQVGFSWTVTGYSGFQGFKLCRSETNPSPSYPQDWWKYVDGENTRSTADNTVKAGHTYYYRLAVYDHGSVLGYSNAVQVTVPGQPQELAVILSARVEGGKVKLSWVVSGEGSYSGFKLCRSETNPNPSYPGDWNKYISYGQNSYTDSDVKSGKSYYYRIGIYKDGSILTYSNSAQAALP